jgi:zinc transporter ZupT
MLFVRSTKSVLADFQGLRMSEIEGLQAKKMFIVIFSMAMHSFAEGLGIGVAFCGNGGAHTGLFVAATLAVHNMPEGLAVALVLVPRGVPKFYTFAMAILSSLPQPLIAVPVHLFVETFIVWESLGLGFAAGAMCWVACLELLPDAAKELSQQTCAGCLCAAFVTMMGTSAWLDSAARNALATTEDEPELGQSELWNLPLPMPEEIWGSRSGGEQGQVAAQHWHSALAERMGFGSSAYVLPLIYSLLAGLSTGIGGFLCLPILGSATAEVPVTAFMLATAAAAMNHHHQRRQ